jgi:hypothetical protein
MAVLVAGLIGTAVEGGAQTPQQILAKPDVQSAMEAIHESEPHILEEQIRLCEIASTPFHEEKRGAELALNETDDVTDSYQEPQNALLILLSLPQ